MNINPIAQTDVAKVAAQTAALNSNQMQPAEQKPAPVKAQPVKTDTVSISGAAQAAAQSAAQEAKETAAQTAQEARNGDAQAQKKLARLNALKGTQQSSPLRPK